MSDYPKSHDPKKIVNSEVFKALNLLINNHAGRLESLQHSIRLRMQELLKPASFGGGPSINLRVSYEKNDPLELKLLFNQFDLKHLSEMIDSAREAEDRIRELQRFKLRLLNDYDFTHGDPSEQIAVFGEAE